MENEFGQTKEFLDRMRVQMLYNRSQDDAERIGILLRNVFLETPDGPEVFEFLLWELYYARHLEHPSQVALHNVAIELLELMGVKEEGAIASQIKNWK